jgi:hypothetical protein
MSAKQKPGLVSSGMSRRDLVASAAVVIGAGFVANHTNPFAWPKHDGAQSTGKPTTLLAGVEWNFGPVVINSITTTYDVIRYQPNAELFLQLAGNVTSGSGQAVQQTHGLITKSRRQVGQKPAAMFLFARSGNVDEGSVQLEPGSSPYLDESSRVVGVCCQPFGGELPPGRYQTRLMHVVNDTNWLDFSVRRNGGPFRSVGRMRFEPDTTGKPLSLSSQLASYITDQSGNASTPSSRVRVSVVANGTLLANEATVTYKVPHVPTLPGANVEWAADGKNNVEIHTGAGVASRNSQGTVLWANSPISSCAEEVDQRPSGAPVVEFARRVAPPTSCFPAM